MLNRIVIGICNRSAVVMRGLNASCRSTHSTLTANVSSPSVYGVSCSMTNGRLEIGEEPRLHLITNTTPNDIIGRPMRNNIRRVRKDTVSTPNDAL